ncbi:MAG: hypothetical protein JW787_12430, partial [Sedimentisphaerales bacterium]|nr:hypothetical protein [Sedimentisphaerales bacterium]
AIYFSNTYTTAANSDMDYNLLDGSGNIEWDSTYADLAAFIAGTEHGDNCKEEDPLFVNADSGDFCLQATSPFYEMPLSPQTMSVFQRFYGLYGIDISNSQIENNESSTEINTSEIYSPIVCTLDVEDIGQTTAKFVGLLEDDGLTGADEEYNWRFIYWKYTDQGNIITTDWGNGTHEGQTFSLTVADLKPDTIYYVVAEVCNSTGTNHGNAITFITLPDPNFMPPVSFDSKYPDAIQIQHINKYVSNSINQQVLTYIEHRGNSVSLDSNDIYYEPSSGENAKIVSLISIPTGDTQNPFDIYELSTDFRPEISVPFKSDALIELALTGDPDTPLIIESALKLWINKNPDNSTSDVLADGFNGKPLTIQRKSSDDKIEYPVWDIKNIIKENDSEMPLYYAITEGIDPNIINTDSPVKTIDKNIPYEWLILSTSREIADIDDSGIIDMTDYSLLLADLGRTGILRSDIASLKNLKLVSGIPDGVVNIYDKIAFIIEYNKKYPDNPIDNPDDYFEGFESCQIQEPMITSKNTPWVIDENSYTHNYCIKSGDIEDGQSSALQVTVFSLTGNISFWMKVSCESEFDNLIFYIDGIEIARWSGWYDWKEVNFRTSIGAHSYKWIYKKDDSVSQGQDAAFLDNINIY